jgi:hypothetical protein
MFESREVEEQILGSVPQEERDNFKNVCAEYLRLNKEVCPRYQELKRNHPEFSLTNPQLNNPTPQELIMKTELLQYLDEWEPFFKQFMKALTHQMRPEYDWIWQ